MNPTLQNAILRYVSEQTGSKAEAAAAAVQAMWPTANADGAEDLRMKYPDVVEPKWCEDFKSFLAMLNSRGYFAGTIAGSAEHSTRIENARGKWESREGRPALLQEGEPATKKADISEEDLAAAADAKVEGNTSMKSGNVAEAVEAYSRSLELNPRDPTVLCNRAAAHTRAGDYMTALADCDAALNLDENYSKAFSRKARAYMFLEQYDLASECFQKVVELDPSNQLAKRGLAEAERYLAAETESSTAPVVASPAAAAPAAAGMPAGMPAGLAGLMSQLGAGGAGGMGDMMSQMMNNPQMMAMASNLMKDPQKMSEMMGMLGGMGGAQ